MAMNRETKRLMQRRAAVRGRHPQGHRAPGAVAQRAREPRTKPRQFVREVNAELRKVAWPTRRETLNLSVIVLIFLVVMTALIAGFDFGFSKAVLCIIDQ